jgi:hypothetical protein
MMLYYLSLASLPPLLRFLCLSGREVSRVRIRGGVAAFEVDWASEEAPALAEPPLNLVLRMHLRIFVYTSNTLILLSPF